MALASDRTLEAALRIQALHALAEGDAIELPELLAALLPRDEHSTSRGHASPELACAALAIIGEQRMGALGGAVESSASDLGAVSLVDASEQASLAEPAALELREAEAPRAKRGTR